MLNEYDFLRWCTTKRQLSNVGISYGDLFGGGAPPVFDGDNYQMWVVRMETYLEAVHHQSSIETFVWRLIVPPLPANPKGKEDTNDLAYLPSLAKTERSEATRLIVQE